MNMIRRLFSIMLVAAMLTAMATTARAVSPLQSNIQPRYVGVSTASANLTISSAGKATVSSRVCASPGYTVNVVVSLERDSGTPVKSWSNSGSDNVIVDEIYYVSHGHNYYVSASIDVFDKNGNFVDSFTTKSSTVSY